MHCSGAAFPETVLRLADLEMDLKSPPAVRRGGKAIDLKPKEYALLGTLLRNADRTPDAVAHHRARLDFTSQHQQRRRSPHQRCCATSRSNFAHALIHTVRGVGYILTDSPP